MIYRRFWRSGSGIVLRGKRGHTPKPNFDRILQIPVSPDFPDLTNSHFSGIEDAFTLQCPRRCRIAPSGLAHANRGGDLSMDMSHLNSPALVLMKTGSQKVPVCGKNLQTA